ncbi:MAG TPA: hypothetical protein VGR35_15855 [Tepidisphaeraceae bacterium]|nr:hypothetical protein [Tepidisphaeraceae bacterium]
MKHDSSQPVALLVPSSVAAKMLSMSERLLFTLTKQGKIPARRPTARMVRYYVPELIEWIKKSGGGNGQRD